MSDVPILAGPERRFPPIVPSWEVLDQALARVMAVRGIGVDQARTLICQVISDRRVEVSVVTDRHEAKQICDKRELSGSDLDIPLHLKPSHFDWKRSRPVKAWSVKPGRLPVEGRWLMRSITVRGEDVTRVLCTPVGPSMAPVEAADAKRLDGNNLAQPKRRGPRPTVRKRVEEAMHTDLASGKLTAGAMADMKEEALAAGYNVSRK